MPFGVGNPVVVGPKARGMSAASFGGEFSPLSISGLLGWYDFSDISTLWQDVARTSAITTDNQRIKGVTNLTGAAPHLGTALNTGGLYKTNIQNGLSVVRLNGVDDAFDLSAASGMTGDIAGTLVYVLKPTATTNADGVGHIGNTGVALQAFGLYQSATNSGKYSVTFAGAGKLYNDSAAIPAGFHIVIVTKSPGVISSTTLVYINGVVGTDAGASSGDTPNVTAAVTEYVVGRFGVFYEGDVGEMMLFNKVLSSNERTALTAHLGDKWGITVA